MSRDFLTWLESPDSGTRSPTTHAQYQAKVNTAADREGPRILAPDFDFALYAKNYRTKAWELSSRRARAETSLWRCPSFKRF